MREAIHTVFLYYAIREGLTMGIVNAGQLGVYADFEPQLRDLVEDVILDRAEPVGRQDPADERSPTERLVQFADRVKGSGAKRSEEHTSELQPLMRISYAVFCLKKKKATKTNTTVHTY